MHNRPKPLPVVSFKAFLINNVFESGSLILQPAVCIIHRCCVSEGVLGTLTWTDVQMASFNNV